MTGTVTNGGSVVLVSAVFLASAVEMVEALTIVLAVGVTKGWRTALEGAFAAVATLTALVLLLGPTLVHLVPLQTLRLIVGGLLLVFGLQWLRKAILRASGLKAKHDEDAIFEEQVAELSSAPSTGKGHDPAGFVVAFKGVFLEGLEVVVVVLTLGSTSHDLGLAAVAAAAAVVVVSLAGLVVARQLSSVPENAMKMAVGLMLVSFGSFWSGEGVGVHWPGSDLAIPVLVGIYALAAWAMVVALKRAPPPADRHRSSFLRREATVPEPSPTPSAPPARSWPGRALRAFGRFWWDFLVGDTPELFVGALVVIGLVVLVCRDPALRTFAAALVPVAVIALLSISVWRAARRST